MHFRLNHDADAKALAISHDGLTFSKPSNLGVAQFNGSYANNLVWPAGAESAYVYHEPGTVFIDTKPGIPAAERFKMVCSWKYGSEWILSSPDGIHWKSMYDASGALRCVADMPPPVCIFRLFSKILESLFARCACSPRAFGWRHLILPMPRTHPHPRPHTGLAHPL